MRQYTLNLNTTLNAQVRAKKNERDKNEMNRNETVRVQFNQTFSLLLLWFVFKCTAKILHTHTHTQLYVLRCEHLCNVNVSAQFYRIDVIKCGRVLKKTEKERG